MLVWCSDWLYVTSQAEREPCLLGCVNRRMEKNLLHINCSLVLLIKLLGTREYNRFINLMYQKKSGQTSHQLSLARQIRSTFACQFRLCQFRLTGTFFASIHDWYPFCMDPA
jgi:hypothetical protein